jgi:RHS repeat-associated protein
MASRPIFFAPRLPLRGRRWLARARRAALPGVAVALVTPLLSGWLPPPPGGFDLPMPLPVHDQHPIPVHAVPIRKAAVPATGTAVATLKPASGTGAASSPSPSVSASAAPATPAPAPGSRQLAGPSAGSVQAGTLPVWMGPPMSAAGKPAPSSVQVSVASRAATAAAGVKGMLFSLARADNGTSAASVHVSVSYQGFVAAYGGDYASRLRLVELPACALTTPRARGCMKATPLVTADNVQTSQLGADVTLPATSGATAPASSRTAAAAASPQVVLAATPTPSSSTGDFTATSLSEAGTWTAGGSSGAFNYSYPINLPPVPGGLAPTVSLSYNSQAVDGLTSSTNNQASWAGDGWDYTPGYVERGYAPCKQVGGSTGDLCWSSNDTTTVWLNGSATTLVNGASGWVPEADNGEKVQYLTGTTNGTHDGGYWVITDPDGTKYYFGLNRLPGYASGDTATSSAWTFPLYYAANGSGQTGCYKSAFASSHCPQAWRWNLDYVTDSHGDAIAYFYNTETNYYAPAGTSTATASYTQGGALSKIEYGLRAGSIYGVTPAAQVNFTSSTSRTDVPADLACSSGATCNVGSPTFWSKYQLNTIATQTRKGTALANVDSWALKHTNFTTGDTNPPIVLTKITRTGEDGTSTALPPVSFGYKAMPDRVETTADINSGYGLINRARITSVTNETGSVTTVNYRAPSGPCTGSGSFPSPDANTLLCFPDDWTPAGMTSPIHDWFNKYVVNQITQTDPTGNGLTLTTNYSYASPAWHYNDDALARTSDRTWDLWRGFHTVTTSTGSAPDPVTKSVDTYFQGMDGDYQSSGSTASVSLTSSHGDKITDSGQFQGMDFEHAVYNGTSGGLVNDTVTIPWTSASQATQAQPSPLPSLRAYMTGPRETDTYTTLAGGGTRESQQISTHDSYGRVATVSSVPDTGDASQDTCTTTTYATSTSAWILDLPAEAKVVSKPCGTTATLPADAVSDKVTFYDGATSLAGDVPTAGDVTETQLATSYSGSTPVYTTQSQASYDEYGRVLTATDADGHVTKTTYTPATGAEPTSKAVTDPMNLVTTTTLDPARDLPLTVTNPAGWVTARQYDSLGRVTAAWTPGHATSTPAQYTFSYRVSASAPSVVTTNRLNAAGTYLPSEMLYDALGRARETQAETADGSRVITDTVYNSDGWKSLVSNSYYATGAPSPTLVAAQDSQVPSQTGYVYDGAGRVTRQIAYSLAKETWETDTTYGGSYVTTVPPSGSTSQTTFTDARGLTSAIYQYHAGVTANPTGPASGYDKTSYTYTPAGQLAGITDAAGNTWSYTYNLAGDRTKQVTPDSGASASAYDAAGQLMSVTDARSKQISYTYDADGRKTASYDTTGGVAESAADQTAGWLYDTVAKGQLSSATSYDSSGNAYTQKIVGYNGYGLPSATETVIPAAQGNLAGNYIQEDFYYANDASLQKYTDIAAGGLPTETVGYSYDNADQPTSVTGTWAYVDSLSHTELGQPLEYTMGASAAPAWIVDSWDAQTGRLTESQTSTGTTPVVVGDIHYGYDPSGNVTSEADAPSGGPSNVQCFQYDYLARLTQAWAQGSGSCASSPSQPAEGGAAPYWDSYSYDVQNNLTGVTSTPPSGPAVTTANTFNPPGAGSVQPHAVASSVSTGSAATTFGYDAAGHTTSVNAPSAPESLSWNDSGQLASVSSQGATTAGYVYDASGQLLIQSDPGSVTLYLPDEQVVLNTSTQAVTGTRFYSLGGATVAARTSAGSVSYLMGDAQGTASMAIDSATLAVTRRYFDPYGNPVGTLPGSWPGTKGFVNGTADTATGLTNLGLREYRPATGSFLSTDPLLSPYNPQDLNPFAYAADNPSTNSDPSGAMPSCGDASCARGFEHGVAQGLRNGYYPPSTPGDYGTVIGLTGPVNVPTYLGGLAPPPILRTPRVIAPHQAATGIDGPGCNQFLSRYGACPSERGAAGTTPQQVKQSFIGAGWILAGALPIDEIIGAVGFGAAKLIGPLAPKLGDLGDTITGLWRSTAPEALTPLEQGAAKVPSAWGDGIANSKGVGTRWFDPAAPKANGIRIDKGIPGSSWPSQQVDHVVVRSGGRILGPDGKPIVGSLRDNPQAHIPLSDWLNWTSWNAP